MLQIFLIVFAIFFLSSMAGIRDSFEASSDSSSLDQLAINITEINPPEKTRLSPFLFYDNHRNAIWTGDITANSSKILEFELNSSRFVIRSLPGVDFVTHIAMDSKGRLWYADPGINSLGEFNPDDGSNRIYPIPSNETSSGIALDDLDNVWIAIPDQNTILEFDTKVDKFNAVNLPPTSSFPLAITSDKYGRVWIAESLGKIASIDPANHDITEFGPARLTFDVPVSILSDPVTGKVYFSEHNAYTVSQFDPVAKTFKRYNMDFGGFPAGLTFDNYDNLWVSQHTLDRIAATDTATGEIKLFDLPQGSLVQWLTSDSDGDILFVDHGSNTLGIIKVLPASVPEFPFAIPILIISLFFLIIFYRIKFR
ncbi:MAG: hypothetical protein KGI27_03350 [Thaumarchaeota archaeon]|nr:hypothetical protein [Nitrososphaerota archaeon]